jgi:hypothetical protein
MNALVHRFVTPFSSEESSGCNEDTTNFTKKGDFFMFGIATTTVSFAEVGFWLGVGLWTLFIGCVWGVVLAALRGNTANPLPHTATKPQTPACEQAA